MSNALEQRIEALENTLRDLKTGPQGPRGPAGPIEAAVANARAAAIEVSRREALHFESKVADLRREFEVLKAAFAQLNAEVEHKVAYQVVQILQEYHIISQDCVPTFGPYAVASLKK